MNEVLSSNGTPLASDGSVSPPQGIGVINACPSGKLRFTEGWGGEKEDDFPIITALYWDAIPACGLHWPFIT